MDNIVYKWTNMEGDERKLEISPVIHRQKFFDHDHFIVLLMVFM